MHFDGIFWFLLFFFVYFWHYFSVFINFFFLITIFFLHLISAVIQAPLPEPLFVTVPPRPQRVLHSEAYIKYIEGLQNETRYLSPWERQLKATPETSTVPDASKLPFHWLGPKSPEKSGDAINALWDLRNHMAKDIVRVINPADY